MLRGYLSRLKRIAELLKGDDKFENIRILWGQENHIPPAKPGVQRTFWVEYAPPGTVVEWNEAEGYYPLLPGPVEKPAEDMP